MRPTIEEGLREIAERAAILRELAYLAAHGNVVNTTPNVWNGLGDICNDIERLAETVRASR
jgi:hypothetical protein